MTNKITESSKERRTLELVDNFFKTNNITYWLEAGTALSAYRDNIVFPWDHDIDIAVWYEQMPEIEMIEHYFEPYGFSVIVQKNFPYIDNIIQLKLRDQFDEKYIDVDIYLYKETEEFAMMRWINTPVGLFSDIKQRILYYGRGLVISDKNHWKLLRRIVSRTLAMKIFRIILFFYVYTSSCIFHRFPKHFFKNLKPFEFYGVKVNIPRDTEEFLEHRYGSGWIAKDPTFNQTGKWKKSLARVRLKLSYLPMPASREVTRKL